jgi:hypothetical protein
MSEDCRRCRVRNYSKAARRVASEYLSIGVCTQMQSSYYRRKGFGRSESADGPEPRRLVVGGIEATTSYISLSRERSHLHDGAARALDGITLLDDAATLDGVCALDDAATLDGVSALDGAASLDGLVHGHFEGWIGRSGLGWLKNGWRA